MTAKTCYSTKVFKKSLKFSKHLEIFSKKVSSSSLEICGAHIIVHVRVFHFQHNSFCCFFFLVRFRVAVRPDCRFFGASVSVSADIQFCLIAAVFS